MKNLPVILTLLLLASACMEPRSNEVFIQGNGPFVYTLDMTDSTVVYDLDLYTRIDAPAEEIPAQTAVIAQWRSPSDSLFRETVYLPLAREVFQLYRAGVSPYEPGRWTLTLTVPLPPEGFRGMGLVLTKTKND